MKIALPKLYRGKKRLAKKMVREGRRTALLRWALTIKPGDYIATCEGSNRKVTAVEPVWKNEGRWFRCKPNKTFFLDEVRFTDSNGRWHHCPGGGCALPAETPEQVHEYWSSRLDSRMKNPDPETFWARPTDFEQVMGNLKSLHHEVQKGVILVDSFGELLPYFQEILQTM